MPRANYRLVNPRAITTTNCRNYICLNYFWVEEMYIFCSSVWKSSNINVFTASTFACRNTHACLYLPQIYMYFYIYSWTLMYRYMHIHSHTISFYQIDYINIVYLQATARQGWIKFSYTIYTNDQSNKVFVVWKYDRTLISFSQCCLTFNLTFPENFIKIRSECFGLSWPLK